MELLFIIPISETMVENTSWIFTKEQLAQTPSRADGISQELENSYRSKGIWFLEELGMHKSVESANAPKRLGCMVT